MEHIWVSVCALNRMKMPAISLSLLNLEIVAVNAPRDPKLRDTLDKMSGGVDLSNIKIDLKVDRERLFVTPIVWSLYSAYHAVVVGSLIIMKALSSGVNDPMKLIDLEHRKTLLKKVLPHQSDYLDKFDATAHYHLLDEIEESLLSELRKMLEGAEVDEQSIFRAAEITKAVRRALPDDQAVTDLARKYASEGSVPLA